MPALDRGRIAGPRHEMTGQASRREPGRRAVGIASCDLPLRSHGRGGGSRADDHLPDRSARPWPWPTRRGAVRLAREAEGVSVFIEVIARAAGVASAFSAWQLRARGISACRQRPPDAPPARRTGPV